MAGRRRWARCVGDWRDADEFEERVGGALVAGIAPVSAGVSSSIMMLGPPPAIDNRIEHAPERCSLDWRKLPVEADRAVWTVPETKGPLRMLTTCGVITMFSGETVFTHLTTEFVRRDITTPGGNRRRRVLPDDRNERSDVFSRQLSGGEQL